jgi:ribosomal protein S18 acetylase RimI-like enzyme
MTGLGEAFAVTLPVVIRPCREEDLPALEWFGLFAPHRALIRRVFEQHLRGEACMLVAEVNGEPAGQLWIEPDPGCAPSAEIWAVRVLPCLQGRGIGGRLVAAAESLLRERGYARAGIAFERDNPRARRWYERLGYACAGAVEARDRPGLAPENGRTQWHLSKELGPPSPQARAPRRPRRAGSASAGPWGT